jgi:hypothetical protein
MSVFVLQFNEEARSPFVKKYKTIIHPGEVRLFCFCHSCCYSLFNLWLQLYSI